MLIDIKYFYLKWQIREIGTSKPRKNVIVKHIESYNIKERYQVDIVFLSNYVWDGFKYIFTMMYKFKKYGWVILLNDKKAGKILRTLKNFVITHNILDWSQTDNGRKFETIFLKNFVNRKILYEFME